MVVKAQLTEQGKEQAEERIDAAMDNTDDKPLPGSVRTSPKSKQTPRPVLTPHHRTGTKYKVGLPARLPVFLPVDARPTHL